ncbi:MAG: hypothetical protein JWQ35_418 [Bacteriovoracaceae bacterium]|nr:hypothetical protein [Bacteriovoracaceae bacterium]
MRWIFVLCVLFCGACTPARILKSFKTPEETFETWRQAAVRLDFETLIACYASDARPSMRKDIEQTSTEGIQEMQREAKNTQFKIEKVVYQKDRAFLRALRKRKNAEDIEVLTMIKEGQEWKLLP